MHSYLMLLLWNISIFFFSPVISTVVCEGGCILMERQIGPGLGIDLGFTYATASIKFANGTIIDVGKIYGSPEYVHAMRTFVKGNRTALTQVSDSFAPQIKPNFYSTEKVSDSFAPQIMAIKIMLVHLKAAVKKVHQTVYPLVTVSVPDLVLHDADYSNHIAVELAAEQAGFHLFGIHKACRSAMYYHEIEDCSGVTCDDLYQHCTYELCDPSLNKLLVISYSEGVLQGTLLNAYRSHPYSVGFDPYSVEWEIERASVVFGHVADPEMLAERPKEFHSEMKIFTKNIIHTNWIDRVILMGSLAAQPKFRKVVGEVLKEGWQISTFKYFKSQETSDGIDECLYRGARGVAVLARIRMRHASGCLESAHCPKYPEHDELQEIVRLQIN